MKKRRIIYISIIALMLLAACGSGDTVADYVDYEEPTTQWPWGDEVPLMWRATSPAGQTMYLFGSIHVGYDSIYPLPDFIMDAFHRSDYLAVEFDLTSVHPIETTAIMGELLAYADGRMAVDDMGEELHQRASAFMTEHRMAPPHNFKPIIWYVLITNIFVDLAGLSGDYGLDMFFLLEAGQRDMGILEVESARLQFEMFAGFSMPLQLSLLEASLVNVEGSVEGMKELFDLWGRGDAQAIEALFQRGSYIERDELTEEYLDALLTQRDIDMTAMARSYMADGKDVFFVVGLGHLLGEGSVVDLLQRYGYDVVIVRY